MIQEDPVDAIVAQARGALAEGAFNRAAEGFSAALALKNDSAPLLQQRGIAHFRLKQWDKALTDFRRAFDLEPTDPENGIGLGLSLAMHNKIYPAIDTLTAVTAAHPKNARAHMQLGLLYYRLCLTAKGRESMDRALAADPSTAERKMIEDILKDEKVADQSRYYRPDFEALKRKNA